MVGYDIQLNDNQLNVTNQNEIEESRYAEWLRKNVTQYDEKQQNDNLLNET